MDERNFYEYAVKKQNPPLFYIKAAAILLGVFALVAAASAAAIANGVGFLAILFIAGGVGFLWYLSRFCAVEYEFTQTEDIFDVAAIYNKQYRREKLSVDLRASAKRIAPYGGKTPAGADGAKVYDFRSSPQAQNAYYILFERDGARGLVLFDAAPRMIEHLFYQAPSITERMPTDT